MSIVGIAVGSAPPACADLTETGEWKGKMAQIEKEQQSLIKIKTKWQYQELMAKQPGVLPLTAGVIFFFFCHAVRTVVLNGAQH